MTISGNLAMFFGLTMLVSLTAPLTSSSARPAPPPTPPPTPSGATYRSTYDYKYASAATQTLKYAARGASATFTVHHPGQVRSGDHSLVELAVAASGMRFTYIEAGWVVDPGEPTRLFVFWWSNGKAACYNFGCGFVSRGPGIQPGARLAVGSTIRLTWSHVRNRWWLFVNGRRSGYYPDRLWHGGFTRTKWFQVFGEVAYRTDQRLCEDMGSGRRPSLRGAARVSKVSFVDGPNVHLSKYVADTADHYDLRLTTQNSFRYGGPGRC
jgi:hypothetical protein